jgi:hypothetical protein
MEVPVLLSLYVVAAVVIAYFLGKKRHIGPKWSLFFSVFLTPIIGLLLTAISPNQDAHGPKPSKFKTILGWIMVVFFVLMFVNIILSSQNQDIPPFSLLMVNVGLIGLGMYFVDTGSSQKIKTKRKY